MLKLLFVVVFIVYIGYVFNMTTHQNKIDKLFHEKFCINPVKRANLGSHVFECDRIANRVGSIETHYVVGIAVGIAAIVAMFSIKK